MAIVKALSRFIGLVVLSVLLLAPRASANILSIDELEALAALRYGNATEAQKALLFARNDAINRAALQGYISDDLYQSAQRAFAVKNQELARSSALAAGADFRVQTASSATYSPGTDSDYITKVTDPDQIRQMQDGYNSRINAYLSENGVNVRRSDWHVQLDTDFMADPSGVTEDQFRTIAKMNNDAYRRRAAAVYEAVSRADDGTRVSPQLFTEYAEEMKDFIAKKQKMIAELRRNPRLLQSPNFQAEFHKLMAQEQKYISRIESSNALLRNQRGLSPIQSLDDVNLYTISKADDGTWRLVRDPSIAKLGSKRAASMFRTTATANAVARNSLENAVERLAQSMAEASLRDPDFAQRAARDIATLLSDFPPARRGAFIEAIARSQGDDVARDIVQAMRAQHRAAIQGSSSALRRWAGRMLDALRVAGVAYDLYQAGDALHEYVTALQAALDPNVTDAEAEALFAKAEAAGARMALAGGLAALFEAYPTVALAMGEFALVNYGTRWVLENTETGRRIDLAVADLFDRHWKAAERFSCDVREFFGYESECERLRAVDQNVLAAVLRGIREGRWQLADGMTMLDVIETIRLGRYSDLDKIVVQSDAWKAATEAIADLERRLAELKQRCQPRAVPASASAPAEGRAGDGGIGQTLRDCHAARQALADVRAARKGVDTSSQRAVERFATAERGIKQCAGLAQLNQAFATAQAASSDAAAAARRFVDLLERSEAAEKLVEDAKTAAAAAVTDADATGDACTKDINNLIDAAAAAEAEIPWDRLVEKVRAVGDAAVGVAESRGGEDSAAERQTLAACAELGDPFEDRLAAMNAILKLEDVPTQRKQIERAAQECRDNIDAEAPPAAPVAAAAGGQGTGAPDATPGRADPVALQNCLCACNQGRTNFSCSYDTEDKGWSPSCRDLSNGPCICKAFGCFRAQPVTSGECAAKCRAKFGG